MKVFLSWSGEPAKSIALAMRDLIDMLCKGVDPWVSAADIQKGARWGAELAKELSTTNMGIIVLTPYNLKSDWLLFEAGALSKSVEDGHVHPLLVGVGTDKLPSPLSQFQATMFRHDDVRDLLVRLASSTPKPGSQSDLYRRFDEQWPSVEKKVTAALELGASLATAQAIDSSAAVQRAANSQKPEDVEDLALNADQMAILSYLAKSNGTMRSPADIADACGMNVERVKLRLSELAQTDVVSTILNMVTGAKYGLGNQGRQIAIDQGWI